MIIELFKKAKDIIYKDDKSVETALDEINSNLSVVNEANITLPSGVTANRSDNMARRNGNTVEISIGYINNPNTGGYIATLPEGFRPSEERCANALVLSSIADEYFTMVATIYPNGRIQTDWTSANLINVFINTCFIV